MPLFQDADGRYATKVEIEVAGSVETCWRAIATAAGISAWFVPAELEERVGGELRLDYGPNGVEVAEIMIWEPGRRFAVLSRPFGPDQPAVETRWEVQARGAERTCVRIVHSIASEDADLHRALSSFEAGWPWFLQALTRFVERGGAEPGAVVMVRAAVPEKAGKATKARTWERFTKQFQLTPAVGEEWSGLKGALTLRFLRVEGEGGYGFLADADVGSSSAGGGKTVPGVASVFVQPSAEGSRLSFTLSLFGAPGRTAAAPIRADLRAELSKCLDLLKA